MLPKLISEGGPVVWLLLMASAVAVAVFVERLLHYHRAQINSTEFLSGVRNVLKRDNVVEAISICDATPGPVARLVKVAIINRERGRVRIQELIEETGKIEVPQLEEKLSLLATIAQIAPLLGLLGTALGFIGMFQIMQDQGMFAHPGLLAGRVWQSLISTAAGLTLSIPCYAGYNYLVSRVADIVLDMEKAASEIQAILADSPKTP